MRKPYFRKDRNAWFVKINGGSSQVRLHEDEKKAYEAWQEMLRLENPGAPNATFGTIADRYLLAASSAVTPKTYRGYEDDLLSACKDFGGVLVRELKKHHVTAWLDRQQTWGTWARRRAASAVKRALSWAVEEGFLDRSPIGKMAIPKGGRREVTISDETHAAMVRASDDGRKPGKRIATLRRRSVRRDAAFRPVLIALKHAGTRPGMVGQVKAENVTAGRDAWVMMEHKTKGKTGAPLVIHLSPCLQTLTRILLAARPSGPLLLNTHGKPWTPNAIRCRMKNLQVKLGLPEGTVAYSYRHSWATGAILAGVDIATIATMMGHKDLRMLMQHYSHLQKQPEHLTAAAAQAMQKRA